MSSLAFKCAFYGPAHNTKGGPHGTDVCSSWNAKVKSTNG